MDEMLLDRILESLIFVSRQPVTDRQLGRAAQVRVAEVRKALIRIRNVYEKRGILLEEVAGGWQFRTLPEAADAVKRLLKAKPLRLSRAAMETLAIVAYRQPCTRAEVDEIRGVESGGVIKFLQDRGFVKIIGKKEEPGRPYLYATTSFFLEFFGLGKLQDLPPLRESVELDSADMPAGHLEPEEPEPSLEEDLAAFIDEGPEEGSRSPEPVEGEDTS